MSTHPPTNEPGLPSFLEQEYRDIEPDLQLVLDCWNSLKDHKALYLPQEEYEPSRAYQNRLDRTRFDNRFEPAIKGHAGLLSDFQLTEDCPDSLRQAVENIDLQGNDLTVIFQQLDEMLLRDGGVALLVEYPKEDPSITTSLDLLQSGRRPYLIPIDRRNILNWETETIGGIPTITRVTIREYRKVKTGLFGSKVKIYYRVLTPGAYTVYEVVLGETGWQAVLIEEGETDLNQVPIVWYSISGNELFVGKPPFLNLAGLNIEHFQKRSSLNEVLNKCNLPVPVRKGLIRSVQDLAKQVVKLIIGANSVVDVPADGDFYFAEPTGAAIGATQADIAKLEGAMDRESLAFLTGGEAQKTATEAIIDMAQTQCTIKGIARRKENAFQRLAVLWCAYTREQPPTQSAGIKVNESILTPPANPQEVQVILDAMGIKISARLGLQMLLQRKWLPTDTNIEAEVAQIEGLDLQLPEAV